MTKLEEIARALCLVQFGDEAIHGDARCCQVGGKDGCCVKELYPQVRAVVMATREPNEQMVMAGLTAGYERNKPWTERIRDRTEGFCASLVTAGNSAIYKAAYQAMIDSILNEDGK